MLDQKFKIIMNDPIAERTFLMGLKAPEIIAQASPGQFVMLRLGSALDPLLRRPFSICGTLEGEILLILYKVVGKGTSIMSEFEKGAYAQILGPLGSQFSKPADNCRVLLVAGGIGIAPLIFLAQRLKIHETVFLAGYRNTDEMIPLRRVGLADGNVILATDDGSMGHGGFVTDLLADRLQRECPDAAVVYACGPEVMLKKVAGLVHTGGFFCEMSLEANMACGLGACQGCAVKTAQSQTVAYHLICRDGPVLPYQSIDWGQI